MVIHQAFVQDEPRSLDPAASASPGRRTAPPPRAARRRSPHRPGPRSPWKHAGEPAQRIPRPGQCARGRRRIRMAQPAPSAPRTSEPAPFSRARPPCRAASSRSRRHRAGCSGTPAAARATNRSPARRHARTSANTSAFSFSFVPGGLAGGHARLAAVARAETHPHMAAGSDARVARPEACSQAREQEDSQATHGEVLPGEWSEIERQPGAEPVDASRCRCSSARQPRCPPVSSLVHGVLAKSR